MGTIILPFRSVILYKWDNEKSQNDLIFDFIEKVPDEIKPYIMGPVNLINGMRVIQFIPSGSKYGWHESDILDTTWTDFKSLLINNFEFPMFLDYQISGDMKQTIINETTDNIIDINICKNEELKDINIYTKMAPVHKLIEKIYSDNPEFIVKHSELITNIITSSGMRDLLTDDRILVDTHWIK